MMYSIIPNSIIFGDGNEPDVSYIRRNGVLMEVSGGSVRRIISTDPSDFIRFSSEVTHESEY